MSNNVLTEIIETLTELRRLHQLNIELLEQLDVVCKWLLSYDVPIPNPDTIRSLLTKAETLLNEIHSSDESLHEPRIRRRLDRARTAAQT